MSIESNTNENASNHNGNSTSNSNSNAAKIDDSNIIRFVELLLANKTWEVGFKGLSYFETMNRVQKFLLGDIKIGEASYASAAYDDALWKILSPFEGKNPIESSYSATKEIEKAGDLLYEKLFGTKDPSSDSFNDMYGDVRDVVNAYYDAVNGDGILLESIDHVLSGNTYANVQDAKELASAAQDVVNICSSSIGMHSNAAMTALEGSVDDFIKKVLDESIDKQIVDFVYKQSDMYRMIKDAALMYRLGEIQLAAEQMMRDALARFKNNGGDEAKTDLIYGTILYLKAAYEYDKVEKDYNNISFWQDVSGYTTDPLYGFRKSLSTKTDDYKDPVNTIPGTIDNLYNSLP